MRSQNCPQVSQRAPGANFRYGYSERTSHRNSRNAILHAHGETPRIIVIQGASHVMDEQRIGIRPRRGSHAGATSPRLCSRAVARVKPYRSGRCAHYWSTAGGQTSSSARQLARGMAHGWRWGQPQDASETMAKVWASVRPMQVLLGREHVTGATTQQAIAGVLVLAAARRFTSGIPSLYSDVGLRRILARSSPGDFIGASDSVAYHRHRSDGWRPRRIFVRINWPSAARLVRDSRHLFPPVRIGDATYVDGGAIKNATRSRPGAGRAAPLYTLTLVTTPAWLPPQEWTAPPSTPPDTSSGVLSRRPTRRERAINLHALASRSWSGQHRSWAAINSTTTSRNCHRASRRISSVPRHHTAAARSTSAPRRNGSSMAMHLPATIWRTSPSLVCANCRRRRL